MTCLIVSINCELATVSFSMDVSLAVCMAMCSFRPLCHVPVSLVCVASDVHRGYGSVNVVFVAALAFLVLGWLVILGTVSHDLVDLGRTLGGAASGGIPGAPPAPKVRL